MNNKRRGIMHVGALMLLTASLIGCSDSNSHSSGDGSTRSDGTASPGGIWLGTATIAPAGPSALSEEVYESIGLVDEAGRGHFLTAIGSQKKVVRSLNFEDYSGGRIIDDEYAPEVTISADNPNGDIDVAVLFDTDNVTGGDNDLAAPYGARSKELDNEYHPGNVLIIQENGPCDDDNCLEPDDEGARPAGKLLFEFAEPVRLLSIDFFDIESDESGGAIRLFNINDEEIYAGVYAVPDTGGNRCWDRLYFGEEGAIGVSRIEVNMGGSGALDNIRYEIEQEIISFVQVVGTVDTDEDGGISGNINVYLPGKEDLGQLVLPTTLTVSLPSTLIGSIIAREELEGIWSGNDGSSGDFAFLYNSLYDAGSSLEFATGTWTGLSTLGTQLALTIDPDGVITGQDESGCVYAGQVSIIDPDYNAYGYDISISSCGDADGDYTGLGASHDGLLNPGEEFEDLFEPGDDAFVISVENESESAAILFGLRR